MRRTVLFLHSSAGRYGADLQLLTLAGRLDRERYEPLAVLPEPGELCEALEAAGVPVVTRPLAVLRRGLLSPGGLAGLAARLRADVRELLPLCRERRVALIHSNTSVVLAGQALARRGGVPHLLHVREIYTDASGRALAPGWPLLRRRLERADALACVSGAVAAQFGACERAFVVHDGLARVPEPVPRAQARRELGLDPDAFAVAVIGRVSDWKGQDVLARALAEPELAGIGAVGLVAGDAFAGDESQEAGLRGLAAGLGLGERLRLLGFRPDVETVLGAADAVAVPSTRPDPLPNSALESAAAGLPVVAAAHGGLPEIVRDGETGLLVAPSDPAALARALASLAADPGLRARLGSAAAADVRERFAPERLVGQVQLRYETLLSPQA